MNRLLPLLRDPAIVGIGTLVAILVGIFTIVTVIDSWTGQPSTASRLVADEVSAKRLALPADAEALGAGVSVAGRGGEAIVFRYRLGLHNHKTVRPGDFVEPLRVSVESPYEILNIDNFDPIEILPSATLQFSRDNETQFTIRPFLLNERESASFAILVAAPHEDFARDIEAARPQLSARIAGLQFVSEGPSSINDLIGHNKWTRLFFGVQIRLAGAEAYLFAIFAALMFGLLIQLRRLTRPRMESVITLSAYLLLAGGTAEVVTNSLSSSLPIALISVVFPGAYCYIAGSHIGAYLAKRDSHSQPAEAG